MIRSIFRSYLGDVSIELSKLVVSTHGKKADLRKQNGQFAHGVSGNPGGRPKDEAQVAKLAFAFAFRTKNGDAACLHFQTYAASLALTALSAAVAMPTISI